MDKFKELIKVRDGLVSYLMLKVDEDDWHGVQDAASDIREVQAKLDLLQELKDEAYRD